MCFDRQRMAVRLRLFRIHQGWSQIEVATRGGLSAAMVSQIEAGKRTPRADTLVKIAKAYRLSLDWLLEIPKVE